MRICIDLDGVICQLKKPGQDYLDLEPVPGAVEKVRQLRQAGHVIIIATARHMKTCEGNLGLTVARIGPKTLQWLEKHAVEYDEIYFGKPYAQVYIDDNAMRFTSWEEIASDGSSLPQHAEAFFAAKAEEEL